MCGIQRIISQPCDLAFQNYSRPEKPGSKELSKGIWKVFTERRVILLLEMLDTRVEIGRKLE